MKTNKLMTAVALSAMFAACTQDAELNETLAKNDFSNIPMVEADFTVNTGVDSRMANGFGWELNDKVGFVWLGGTGTNITVNGDAYQNNPLYCIDTDAKAFKSEGMFYVGQYFAYMPYTEGNHMIEPIKFNVTKQPLTTDQANLAKHTIYISPEVYTLEQKDKDGNVGEGKLPSGVGQNLPLNIARVSNFATINLTFANAEDLTDLKVYSVSLDAKVGTASVLPTSFVYAPITSAAVTNKEWKGYKSKTFYNGDTRNTYGAIEATSEAGLAVEDGALTVKMLTMPRDAKANIDAFTVQVKTNYGDVTVDLTDVYGDDKDACIAFTEGGKDKTIENTSLFNDFGSAGTINVYVDMDNKVIANPTVKTQAALEETLEMLATAGYEQPVTITLNPDNANKAKNFVLTDFTLPEGLKCVVTLQTGKNASNGIEFAGETTINKQLGVLSASTVTGTMTVENLVDANDNQLLALYAAVPMTIANEATLVNNGKIQTTVITTAATTGTNAKAAGKYVSNSEDACFAQGGITNYGETQWIAGALPTMTQKGAYAEVVDFKSMMDADEHYVRTARFVNASTFNNLNQDVTIKNIAKIEVYADVTMNINKNALTGAATKVDLIGVTSIVVKEGASLNIISDLGQTGSYWDGNGFYTNNGVVETEKNTTLLMEKVDFGAREIKYAGKVTSKYCNIDHVTKTKVGDGVYEKY